MDLKTQYKLALAETAGLLAIIQEAKTMALQAAQNTKEEPAPWETREEHESSIIWLLDRAAALLGKQDKIDLGFKYKALRDSLQLLATGCPVHPAYRPVLGQEALVYCKGCKTQYGAKRKVARLRKELGI